jgi:hypothetical protein
VIANASLQAVYQISSTRFSVAYGVVENTSKYGVGRLYEGSAYGYVLKTLASDHDVGGGMRVFNIYTDDGGMRNKVWCSGNTVWLSPNTSTGYLSSYVYNLTNASYNQKSADRLVVGTNVYSGDYSANSGYDMTTTLLPKTNFVTKIQMVDVDWNAGTMTLSDSISLANIPILDGGQISEGLYWFRDEYGNYVEGSLFELARQNVGIATGNHNRGDSASIALFGAKIEAGFSGLTVGASILDEVGEEFAYAVSESEVVMAEKV